MEKNIGILMVVYGRRRIGITRLLTEFMADKKGIFYITEDTSIANLTFFYLPRD